MSWSMRSWRTPDGRAALNRRVERNNTRVVVVNAAGSDGIAEGVCGFVPLTEDSEFFFKLLDHHDRGLTEKEHPLGGDDLRWEEGSCAHEWARECMQQMPPKVARAFVQSTLGIDVPKRDEDDDLIEDVAEYLDENEEEWETSLQEKIDKLFSDYSLLDEENPTMLSAEDVGALSILGRPVKIEAVVTISLDNWG